MPRKFRLDVRMNFAVRVAERWKWLLECPSLGAFQNNLDSILYLVLRDGWLCLSREVGPYDPLWSLPILPNLNLWFLCSNFGIHFWVCNMFSGAWEGSKHIFRREIYSGLVANHVSPRKAWEEEDRGCITFPFPSLDTSEAMWALWYLLIFAPKMVIFFELIGYCQNKSSIKVDSIKLQKYRQLITQSHCILLTLVPVFNFSVIKTLIHFWCVLEEDSYYYHHGCHPDLKYLEQYFWDNYLAILNKTVEIWVLHP